MAWYGMFDYLTLKTLLIMKHHLCRLVAVDPQAILEMWIRWNHLKSVPAAQYPPTAIITEASPWPASAWCRAPPAPCPAPPAPSSGLRGTARRVPGWGREAMLVQGQKMRRWMDLSSKKSQEVKLDVFFFFGGWIYVINVTINRMLRAHTHTMTNHVVRVRLCQAVGQIPCGWLLINGLPGRLRPSKKWLPKRHCRARILRPCQQRRLPEILGGFFLVAGKVCPWWKVFFDSLRMAI